MKTLKIYGWNEGFNKVQMTKLLCEQGGLKLLDAKKATDEILEGKEVQLSFEKKLAMDIMRQATNLGAKCDMIN